MSNTGNTSIANDNTELVALQVRIPAQVNQAVEVRAAKLALAKRDAVAAALAAWAPEELAELQSIGASR